MLIFANASYCCGGFSQAASVLLNDIFQLHPWYVYDSHNQIAEVKGMKTYWIFVNRHDVDMGQDLSRFCPHFLLKYFF